ncbi:MAG: hypothetical protein A2374_04685 [Candidatus Moranbacteria bacterium RIFOXYB1_FULL_44_23]|nr:MAG: hypothetical protein A2184_00875 [Candidatus Moranbacteria bacterium RIFOXYA1_FULL_44_7]OGI33307.1 MAG: hypothetical protein A2420_03345 [Candidatus Moranbacteria bacterium RIFOXYC1_FULL_44_13]OGI37492.1 MAG: hypothetical protein A2612_05110 [Candidatus Moranbacteria bacterium RIFOXYD1_FULL_44_12]OGI39716.1 MAG: hypothetical protein A2374_04685 [Candidatus Moranbacteria bacterium RIFOXYB1_FULL_44_23]
MTVRSYLWGMRLSTLAALAALGAVVYHVDPIRDGILGQVLFYTSLFFSITGMATLFLFWIRRRWHANEMAYQNVGLSFRQGILVALAVCAMFVLQSFRLLLWWDAGIVVVGVLLVELWFLSK